MQRRNFVKTTAISLAALTLFNKSPFAQWLTAAGYKITMLTKSIGIFTEKGGTILFQLGKDGTVVVDSQFEDSVGHLIAEINKKTDLPFALLINTHHHGDHTAGNIAFKNLTSHILAHANSKKNQEAAAIKSKTEHKQYYPTETFTENFEKKINKEKICLHYFGAGHTDGDSLVQFKKANIIHVGDLVFNRRHPFVDRSAGANIASWIKVLEKTVATFPKKTKYVCGHAGEGYEVVINATDVLAFRDYLKNVLLFTAAEIKSGKTLAEILQAKEIPGAPEWKGDGIERPLTAAYEELTMK